ncbi:MAG TPA: copper chaperone PCu(A)C [Streptosporangiaceae bacterium]|jgi:copper(I)-binding protein|nr:copper chaperone PCu(A)C [Streptosporangiaceae bacterium]
MLRSRGRPPRRPKGAALAACALAATLGVSGCTAAAAADQQPSIQATSAYVPLPITPGMTYAYLAIRNYTSTPDRLVSASTSVGGRVALRAPAAGSGQMRNVSTMVVPPNSVLRLVPDGPHLLITGAGPMQNGKTFTLTLVFSHGGRVPVTALVTNPQDTQGSNYSMN